MKKLIFMFVLSAVVGTGLAWTHEGHDAEHGSGGKEITVKGELVDMACYMAHEGKGSKHADCAKMLVVGGAPLGIVPNDGAVYLLVEDHSSVKCKRRFSQAKKLVAQTATIRGEMYQRGGVQAIVVESVTQEKNP